MRILVTGATGFLGGNLCPALAAAGHEVVPVGVRRGVPRFDGAQAVIHLARADAMTTQQVGREAAAAKAQLVFVSSVKVHGEESQAPFTGESKFSPQDAYAATKVEAEAALRAIAGLRLVVLRPPLVYGPGVKANFLALMRAIHLGVPLPLAGITNRRSLVYAGNLVDAVLRCAVMPQAAGRSYVISDGAAVSTPALCRAIGGALGQSARLFAMPAPLLELAPGLRPLTRSLELDDGALRAELDWRPVFTFEQGLAETVRWYRHT